MRLAKGPLRPLVAGRADGMEELFADADKRAERAMQAMLGMRKLDIAALRRRPRACRPAERAALAGRAVRRPRAHRRRVQRRMDAASRSD